MPLLSSLPTSSFCSLLPFIFLPCLQLCAPCLLAVFLFCFFFPLSLFPHYHQVATYLSYSPELPGCTHTRPQRVGQQEGGKGSNRAGIRGSCAKQHLHHLGDRTSHTPLKPALLVRYRIVTSQLKYSKNCNPGFFFLSISDYSWHMALIFCYHITMLDCNHAITRERPQ